VYIQDLLTSPAQLNDDLTGGVYSSLLEKLRARLQQREGEVAALREELRRMQARSDVLTTQVGDGAAERAELEERVKELAAVSEESKVGGVLCER
jgi:chromosome segregation ATPase